MNTARGSLDLRQERRCAYLDTRVEIVPITGGATMRMPICVCRLAEGDQCDAGRPEYLLAGPDGEVVAREICTEGRCRRACVPAALMACIHPGVPAAPVRAPGDRKSPASASRREPGALPTSEETGYTEAA